MILSVRRDLSHHCWFMSVLWDHVKAHAVAWVLVCPVIWRARLLSDQCREFPFVSVWLESNLALLLCNKQFCLFSFFHSLVCSFIYYSFIHLLIQSQVHALLIVAASLPASLPACTAVWHAWESLCVYMCVAVWVWVSEWKPIPLISCISSQHFGISPSCCMFTRLECVSAFLTAHFKWKTPLQKETVVLWAITFSAITPFKWIKLISKTIITWPSSMSMMSVGNICSLCVWWLMWINMD